MLDWITYAIRRNRLFSEQDKIHREFQRDLNNARSNNKTPEEIQQITGLASSEHATIQEEIDMLATSYLSRRASRLFLHLPEISDKETWAECDYNRGRYVLTNKGITALKIAIRAETKDTLGMMLQVFTISIGVIGAITGLVSTCSKHH